MAENLWQDFHFIRPYGFLLILPALCLCWFLWRRRYQSSGWQAYIDASLLQPLISGKSHQPGYGFSLMLAVFWIIAAVALSGPTWKKLPQAVERIDNALVIVLDLSPSMLAADLKPNRMVVARHKVIDLLKARHEGYTALVVFSGDAHVVSPLTEDNQTIINLVHVLEPAIMPIDGSNVEHGLSTAFNLFQNAGYTNGDILLLTDGITETALEHSIPLFANSPFRLSIIGIGTESGGPIPSARGGFIKDAQGNIIMPALRSHLLQQLAHQTHGHYTALQLSDADILPLVKGRQRPDQQQSSAVEREFDQWQDHGAYLVLPLLILFLFAFRRGFILVCLWTLPFFQSPSATANDTFWEKLWLNDNQRAMKAMERQDFENAAKNFHDEDWKASAQYESSDYQAAIEHFRDDTSAKGSYNKGNALAKSGNLKGALQAYENALKQRSDFDDAKFNKALVEKLLEEQKSSNENSSKDNQENQQTDQQGSKQSSNPEESQDSTNNSSDEASSENTDQNKNDSQDNSIKESAKEDQNRKDHQPQASDKAAPQKNPSSQEKTSGHQGEPLEMPAPTAEEQQAMEQWLRKVPDDPSSLLRNKFEYYYRLQLQKEQQGKSPVHLNSEERW